MSQSGTKAAQFRGAAQHAVDEKTMNDHIQPERELDEILDEFVGHGAPEPVAPALRVESEQMVTVCGGFPNPELSDRTAIDKNVVHYGSPDVLNAPRPTKAASSLAGRSPALRIVRYIAMHRRFDNVTTDIPAPHQMKLNSSLVHGKTPKSPPETVHA